MEKKKTVSASERQKALDEISPEDLDKIKGHQEGTHGAFPVDQEWLLMAEFAKAYGWEAYKDARDDKIEMPEMMTLIQANRKLEAMASLRDARDIFIGIASAQSKKPTQAFRSLTKDIVKQTKVMT